MRRVLVVVFFLLPFSLLADIVTLKTADQLEGTIIIETETFIVLKTSYGEIEIEKGRIAKIERESSRKNFARELEGYLRDGKPEKAVAALRKRLKRKPEETELREQLRLAHLECVRSRRERGMAEATLKAAEEALRDFPGDREFLKARRAAETLLRKQRSGASEVQVLLDVGKPVQALKRLEALSEAGLSREPFTDLYAQAYLGIGEELFEKEKLDQALANYDKALELRPEYIGLIRNRWLICTLQKIAAEINSAEKLNPVQWRDYVRKLKKALEVSPGEVHALYNLAICYESLGETEEAAKLYAEILHRELPLFRKPRTAALRKLAAEKLEKTPIPAQRVSVPPEFREADEGDWQVLDGKHFRVFHHNAGLARRVLNVAEYYRKHLASLFERPALDERWDKPCEIYLYRNRQEFEKALPSGMKITGRTLFETRDGKLHRHSIETFQSAPDLLSGVLAHETMHAVFNALRDFRKTKALWLAEGIAVWNEPSHRKEAYRRAAIEERKRGNYLDLDTLLGTTEYPENLSLDAFYGESLILVEILLERAEPSKLLDLAELLDKKSAAEAFIELYGEGPSDIEVEWLKGLMPEVLSGASRLSERSRAGEAAQVLNLLQEPGDTVFSE